MVADELAERWGLPRAKPRFRASARRGPRGAGPRAGPTAVAVLWPQTFMNEAGRSVGPARGSYKLALERVVVVHDEIDLPFGEVRTRLGRRPGGPQRAEVAQAGARAAQTSGACAWAWGARTRPIRRSSPRTCSAASARAPRRCASWSTGRCDEVERLVAGAVSLRSLLGLAQDDTRGAGEHARARGRSRVRFGLAAPLPDRGPRRDRRAGAAGPRPTLVVVGDDRAARELAGDLRAWLAPRRVRYYPSRGVAYESHLTPPPHLVGLRVAALDALLAASPPPSG